MKIEEVACAIRFVNSIIIALLFAMGMENLPKWIRLARGRGEKLQDFSETLLSIVVPFFDQVNVQTQLASDTMLQEHQEEMRTVQQHLQVLNSWNMVEYVLKAEKKLVDVEFGLMKLQIFLCVWRDWDERKSKPVNVVPPQVQGQEIKKDADRSDVVQPLLEE